MKLVGVPFGSKSSDSFVQSTAIFNGDIQTPALFVVFPRSEEELAKVVDLARERNLGLSLKAGGHGVAGRSVMGQIVVDLRNFDKILFDEKSKSITVGAGVRWAELDRACEELGVVVPGGAVSSTGVAGLTLGGGIGWLLPSMGLTCDHLVSARLVDGLGRTFEVNDRNFPSEMKVIRGCGHGLAAFTQMKFECRSAPDFLSAGSVIFNIDVAPAAINKLLMASAECPTKINFSPAILWREGTPLLSVDGVSFDRNLSFSDFVESVVAEKAIRSTVHQRKYSDLQSMLDEPGRWGQNTVWRSWFSKAFLSLTQVEELVEGFLKSDPNSSSMVLIERITGAARQERRPSSYPFRQAVNNVLVIGTWDRASDKNQVSGWASQLVENLGPGMNGTYVNYSSRDEVVTCEVEQRTHSNVVQALDPEGTFSVSRPNFF